VWKGRIGDDGAKIALSRRLVKIASGHAELLLNPKEFELNVNDDGT
jgi:hypothetical protein